MTVTPMKKQTGVRFHAAKGKAEITLYGDIGYDITAKQFATDLKALGDVDEMTLRLNSFGGDVFDGVAIYSRLRDHKARKIISIDGIAASAASVIAMAGDEIRITEAGFVMIHDAWVMTMGNAADLRKQADRLEAVSTQIAGIYERRTGKTMDAIREWMAAETEFNADEAVANGFADSVFAGERMAAKFDPERHHFRRPPTPALPERLAAGRRLVDDMRIDLIR